MAGPILIAAMAAGCSLFEPERPDLTVSLQLDEGVGTAAELVVDVGGKQYRVSPGAVPASRAVRVQAPREGALDVRAVLRATDGTEFARISFPQEFREGYDHWISAIVGKRRPLGFCIGTLLVAPVATTRGVSVNDTLFLMYGSIPRDAVC